MYSMIFDKLFTQSLVVNLTSSYNNRFQFFYTAAADDGGGGRRR